MTNGALKLARPNFSNMNQIKGAVAVLQGRLLVKSEPTGKDSYNTPPALFGENALVYFGLYPVISRV